MTHDPLCHRLRLVMSEEPRPPLCPWCSKISIIRSDESLKYREALDRAYYEGYERGRSDEAKEKKWSV